MEVALYAIVESWSVFTYSLRSMPAKCNSSQPNFPSPSFSLAGCLRPVFVVFRAFSIFVFVSRLANGVPKGEKANILSICVTLSHSSEFCFYSWFRKGAGNPLQQVSWSRHCHIAALYSASFLHGLSQNFAFLYTSYPKAIPFVVYSNYYFQEPCWKVAGDLAGAFHYE